MKKTLCFFAVLAVFFISCNNGNTKKTETASVEIKEEKPSILGVWERTSFYNYDETGKVTDSFAASDENRHIKIFTPSKVMWCRNVSSDSSEWFGYGNYEVHGKELVEHLEYGSIKMSEYIKASPDFVFDIELSDKTFSQIQMDDEGHPIFAENYVRLE